MPHPAGKRGLGHYTSPDDVDRSMIPAMSAARVAEKGNAVRRHPVPFRLATERRPHSCPDRGG